MGDLLLRSNLGVAGDSFPDEPVVEGAGDPLAGVASARAAAGSVRTSAETGALPADFVDDSDEDLSDVLAADFAGVLLLRGFGDDPSVLMTTDGTFLTSVSLPSADATETACLAALVAPSSVDRGGEGGSVLTLTVKAVI